MDLTDLVVVPQIGRFWLLCQLVGIVCICTRLLSGFRFNKSAGQSVRVVPYWIPFIGHAISFITDTPSLVKNARDLGNDGLVAILMGGRKFSIVVAPSIVKALWTRTKEVDSQSFIESFMTRIFDFNGEFVTDDEQSLYKQIHTSLVSLSRDMSLVGITSEKIEATMPSLTSYQSKIPFRPAKEVSCSRVPPEATESVDIDLSELLSYYVRFIATSTLMGNDIVTNNPNLIGDQIRFETDINLLAMGLPQWLPYSRHSRLVAARGRINQAISGLHSALETQSKGADPGFQWSDLASVPQPMKKRAEIWRKAGLNAEESAPRDAALLFGATANVSSTSFWCIYHVLKTPGLLSLIRDEIGPFARFIHPVGSEDRGALAPGLALDGDGLFSKCPLLKATLFETLRLEFPGMACKKMKADLTVTESAQDALSLRGQNAVPRSYHLRKGEFLLVPFFSVHTNPKFFPDPETFNPWRHFIDGKLIIDSNLTPFGGGATVCKGKGLAEKECLLLLAGIFAMWDLSLVDDSDHPGHEKGAAAYRPRRRIRVRFIRRTQETE